MNTFGLPAGTVVAIDTSYGPVPIRHVGVLSDRVDQRGYPFVFNASQRSGRTLEEPWAVFCDGREGMRMDLWGSLSSGQIVRRARERLELPWDLFSWNCEHYVRWCHGLDLESPQLRTGVGVAVGTAAVAALVAAIARS